MTRRLPATVWSALIQSPPPGVTALRSAADPLVLPFGRAAGSLPDPADSPFQHFAMPLIVRPNHVEEGSNKVPPGLLCSIEKCVDDVAAPPGHLSPQILSGEALRIGDRAEQFAQAHVLIWNSCFAPDPRPACQPRNQRS